VHIAKAYTLLANKNFSSICEEEANKCRSWFGLLSHDVKGSFEESHEKKYCPNEGYEIPLKSSQNPF